MDTTGTPPLHQLPHFFADILHGSLDVRLAAIEALTDAIATADPIEEAMAASPVELAGASMRADAAIGRLMTKRLDWIVAEESAGLWAVGKRNRTYASHLAQTHHMSHARAAREIRLARKLRGHLPGVMISLRLGRIGIDQAQVIAETATTSRKRRAALAMPAALTDVPADTGTVTVTVTDTDTDTDTVAADGAPEAPSIGGVPVVTVEDLLIEHAIVHTPEELRVVAKHFAALADPEADERGYVHAKEREYLDIDRTIGGFNVSGFLSEEAGQLLRTAVDTAIGVPPAADTRTGGQRRAQAVADLARIALDQGLVGAGQIVRPHIGVLISFPQFLHLTDAATPSEPVVAHTPASPDGRSQPALGVVNVVARPPAGSHVPVSGPPAADSIDWRALLAEAPATWIDGTGPVPPAILRKLAGSADVYRVIFGPGSEILNVGRKHRLFTAAQRRAIIARDRHCVYPDCTAPPALTEAHHALRHWADGGHTSTDCGALLCGHHHHYVDTHGITMTWSDGWRFSLPDGASILANRRE